LFAVEYTAEEFVEFIDNGSEQCFERIEAIVSLLCLQHSDYPNQMQDVLKILRLLRHHELGIYCSYDRSRCRHKEFWMIEEDYQIILPDCIVGYVLVWLKDVS
jgi:hypothetical protein